MVRLLKKVILMGKAIDMTGFEFERFKVVKREKTNKDNRAMWQCLCTCGNYFVASGKAIRSGNVSSCGCFRKYTAASTGRNNATHGETNSRLYNIWRGMKQRCYNENSDAYDHYGRRGIVICEEWKTSFESFYKWAFNNGYKDNLTIDRINVNGNYEPSNCRWETTREQNRNKQHTVYVEYHGELMTVSDIAEIKGVSVQAIYYRLQNNIDIDKPIKEKPEDKIESNKEVPKLKESDLKETPESKLPNNKETRNPNKYMD